MSNPHFDGLLQQNFNWEISISVPPPFLLPLSLTLFPIYLFNYFFFAFQQLHPSSPASSGTLCEFQNIPECGIELAWNGISKRDNFHYKNRSLFPAQLCQSQRFSRKSLYTFCFLHPHFFITQTAMIYLSVMIGCLNVSFNLTLCKTQVWLLELHTLVCHIQTVLKTSFPYRLSQEKPCLTSSPCLWWEPFPLSPAH